MGCGVMNAVQNQLAELDTELADIKVKSGQLTKDLAKLDAELADLERQLDELTCRIEQGVTVAPTGDSEVVRTPELAGLVDGTGDVEL
jgi:predicted  nucleic acid-binding Zn-ribbon protein